jgi:hypothetical protein
MGSVHGEWIHPHTPNAVGTAFATRGCDLTQRADLTYACLIGRFDTRARSLYMFGDLGGGGVSQTQLFGVGHLTTEKKFGK